MRYSRISKRRRQRNHARIAVLGLVLFIIIYVVSAGAIGKYLSGIIAPKLGGMDEDKENVSLGEKLKDDDNNIGTDNNGSKTNKSGDKEIKKITKNIEIAPFTIYTIQMAAFSTEANAQEFASTIQSRGGAGYIVDDKYFRVLAVGYIDENDINKVKSQLEANDIKCEIYKMSCPGANMEVTASKEKVDGVNAAFSLWQEKLKELENIVKDLDNKDITGEVACERLKGIKLEMEETLTRLSDYKAAEGSSDVLTGLEDIYKLGIESFEELLGVSDVNGVVFSSKIKYTYINMASIYKSYMDALVKKRE